MEEYRGELWFSKLAITLIMSRPPSVFTSKMTVISDWLFFLIVLMTFICYKFITTNPAFSSLLKFSLLIECNSHFLLTTIHVNPLEIFHKLMEKYLCNIFIFRLLNVDYRFLLASSCKMPILGQVALNDPAQNPIWETSALNDPTSEQLKEISQVALNDPDPQKKKSLKHPLLKKKKN